MPAPRKFDEETRARAVRMYQEPVVIMRSRGLRPTGASGNCWVSTRRRCGTG